MSTLPTQLHSIAFLVSAEAISAYAQLTQDFNPIHLDPDFAARTPMGGVIAHGTMSISLIWRSLAESLPEALVARIRLDLRFVKPVRVNERLIAGGQQHPLNAACYEVWVKGEVDGVARLAGTATLGN